MWLTKIKIVLAMFVFYPPAIAISSPGKNVKPCSDITLTNELTKQLTQHGKMVFSCQGLPSVFASSAVRKVSQETHKYSPENIRDGYLSQAWCVTNHRPTQPEMVVLRTELREGTYLNIFPGFGKSRELFKLNNRLKKIKLFVMTSTTSDEVVRGKKTEAKKFELNKIHEQIIDLKDVYGFQSVEIPFFSQTEGPLFLEKKNPIYLGIALLEVYPGSKYNDSCISEIRLPSKILGKNKNLYSPDEGTLLISARFKSSELPKIKSFWLENKDRKRSGWISFDSLHVSEISNVESHIQNTSDCGPECEVPDDIEYIYSLSAPLNSGLKFSVSAKDATSLHIVLDYFGKDNHQEYYDLIPTFENGDTEVFHLTDLGTSPPKKKK
ncbi:MAG: hypothetical protein JNM39_10695 [Bdellovibrionaceae bacterium]|nr:hypothetical protein [Pseudobdellovibrionaceae bacterium]